MTTPINPSRLGRALCPSGCGRSVARGHLMCRGCWREVPREIQREVNRAWRAWSADLDNTEKRHAYRAARDAALGCVR